jgi:DNA-binding NtrC family response regulator
MSTSAPVVLVIDDERNTRDGLRRAFRRKYEILLAENAARGLELLRDNDVDVIVTDLRMPGMDGMALTREITAKDNAPIVIMLTAYGTIETSVQAMNVGAYDYLTKPIDLDSLEMVIDRGLEARRERRENDRDTDSAPDGFAGIVGRSKAMVDVFETVRQVADARSTVLLTGESGTGKELFAKSIHELSPRSDGPFVVVHCAALNQNLLESELFGHEKGAFTSAHERSVGRFELADGGTLFLDEIGEIDLATQVKLLRVLETRTFERVGGNKPIQVDVRLVAATNRDLKAMVDDGEFREDLFYRLNVVNITLPPLRGRQEDLPILLDHFLQLFAGENGKKLTGFAPEALDLLKAYAWPGNVRELRNCVERMVVMARGDRLTLKDVPADIRNAVVSSLHLERETPPTEDEPAPRGEQVLDIDANERNLIVRALQQTNGNRTEAARILGISRRTLHRKLHTYNLEDL